jgi:hypothetical protein
LKRGDFYIFLSAFVVVACFLCAYLDKIGDALERIAQWIEDQPQGEEDGNS